MVLKLLVVGLVMIAGVWLYKRIAMLRFLNEAVSTLEGMLPAMEASAREFEEAWKQAWHLPEFADLEAYFGAPPCPEVVRFYERPELGDLKDLALAGGLTLGNFFPAKAHWTVNQLADLRRPNEYPFGHDEEGGLYVLDWSRGGPVTLIALEGGERRQVADSLDAFLEVVSHAAAQRR
jgi:hypothetical protein